MRTLRLALAQINHIVGDLEGNSKKVIDYINKAKKINAEIIAFPEMALTGYPPEDLLLKPEFIEENLYYLHKLLKHVNGIIVISRKTTSMLIIFLFILYIFLYNYNDISL